MGFAEETEIVVIGGGPGGSTTATRLAQKGRRVLLLERDELPRFHIGESLLPSSTPVLRELGVFEELDRVFLRKYGARFLDDGDMAEAQYLFSEAFPPAIPHAWQVTRYDFDEILIRNAQKHGVEVRENTKVRTSSTKAPVRSVSSSRTGPGSARRSSSTRPAATRSSLAVARTRSASPASTRPRSSPPSTAAIATKGTTPGRSRSSSSRARTTTAATRAGPG
jgi:hypothetical protein